MTETTADGDPGGLDELEPRDGSSLSRPALDPEEEGLSELDPDNREASRGPSVSEESELDTLDPRSNASRPRDFEPTENPTASVDSRIDELEVAVAALKDSSGMYQVRQHELEQEVQQLRAENERLESGYLGIIDQLDQLGDSRGSEGSENISQDPERSNTTQNAVGREEGQRPTERIFNNFVRGTFIMSAAFLALFGILGFQGVLSGSLAATLTGILTVVVLGFGKSWYDLGSD